LLELVAVLTWPGITPNRRVIARDGGHYTKVKSFPRGAERRGGGFAAARDI
jgi:hypothetical protein